MGKQYDHQATEKKWQKFWEKEATWAVREDGVSQKKYVLDMFPYPSAEGLHVGHPEGYTASDIMARFFRMQGFNVLHPMGWDAFGLPAENFAIKTGTHPKEVTEKNIKNFKRQIQSLGFSYDWSREINTTDPDYYRWTQWIFLQLYKKGLAYEAVVPINWCPSCKTGLANEEVVGGKCDRCGTPVVKKDVRQWMLRITMYADRLLKGLEKLDWPEPIKLLQRNWIGRSEGALIKFQITNSKSQANSKSQTPNPKLFIGTKNPAKKKRYVSIFKSLGVEVLTFDDLSRPIEIEVVEGADIKQNALAKAKAYHAATGLPTLAIDEAFYIEKFPADRQPGPFVRRIPGVSDHRPTDEEMLKYYASEVKKIGGESPTRWDFAVAYVDDTRQVERVFPVSTSTIVAKQSKKIKEGYPLDSLQIDLKTGKYRSELTAAEERQAISEYEFQLQEFVGAIVHPVESIEVFTTRADTLFGATYLVVAPEHPLVSAVLGSVKNRATVEKYIEKARSKSELERTSLEKEKTGVELKGVHAINPGTGKKIPVWVSDYVLISYGTGAIMAVPAHDERDYVFAKKYRLPITQVIAPLFENTTNLKVRAELPIEKRYLIYGIVRNPKDDTFLCLEWTDQPWGSFVVGGIEGKEGPAEAAKREILEETGYKHLKLIAEVEWQVHTKFFAPHKNENRYGIAFGVVFDLIDQQRDPVSTEEKNKYQIKWIPKNKVRDFITHRNAQFIWDNYLNPSVYNGDGVMINSGQYNDLSSIEGGKQITNWLRKNNTGKHSVSYKLRDWVFSRQRYWGEPIPLIHCEQCGIVPVAEDALPVKLPDVKKYEPTGTGESPLAAIADWVKTKCPKCKGEARRETNTMPQWAGSCWYYLRYLDPANKKELVSHEKEQYWMSASTTYSAEAASAGKAGKVSEDKGGVDVYIGGAEHAVLHLMYARFWHMFLHDLGVVSTVEPFHTLKNQGMILGEDGQKMSKSRGNVINPDTVVKEFGADSVRMYEMFMGPFAAVKPWSTQGLRGVYRFLQRVWQLQEKVKEISVPEPLEKMRHKLIKKITHDITTYNFNTAVSTFMETINTIAKQDSIPKRFWATFLVLLSPFAPHMAEELWQTMGHEKTIAYEKWPNYKEDMIQEDTVEYIVQVNGKLRDRISAPVDSPEAAVQKLALTSEKVKKYVSGLPKKVIFVKNRIINFVV